MQAGEQYFFEATAQAIGFLRRLDLDEQLQQRCMKTDLDGRLDIAFDLGYDFSVDNLLVAIRIWDYHGTWRQWASLGQVSGDVNNPMIKHSDLESLPDLSKPYDLSDEQIQYYRENGHVMLPGVACQAEMDIYRPVIRDAVKRFEPENVEGIKAELSSFSEAGFISVLNLRNRDEACRRYVLSRRFAKIAADLLGVDRVRVYLDETFNKASGNCQTHWHQDNTYFPLDSDNVITLWMPLKDTTVNMGTLSFASNSHRERNYGYYPINKHSDEHFKQFINDKQFTIKTGAEMKAGDATFHNGWLLHRSAPNTSEQLREAMTIVYYPDDTNLVELDNTYLNRAIEYGFRAKPGDLASSPIHPIVFDRNS